MANFPRLTAPGLIGRSSGRLPEAQANSAVPGREIVGVPRQAVEAQPRTEWRRLAGLGAIEAEWALLAQSALDRNIFYEPGLALPAAGVFGTDVGAVLVWAADKPERLIGLFPARIERRRYGFGPAMLLGWSHPYAPFGVPLVHAAHAEAAIAAWLNFVMSAASGPRVLLLPLLSVEGRFADALRRVLVARGGQCAAVARHQRAAMRPGSHQSEYLRTALSRKKRKELNRQRRRLAANGKISFVIASREEQMEAALQRFMALESAGWKGKAGTAALSDGALTTFMQQAITALARTGQAQVAFLRVGKQLAAAAILLRSGPHAWFWKTAYAEEFARTSPGVQLALELTRKLLADTSIAEADSCATPDHPMIDHLWRERLAIADVLIAPDARSKTAFQLARALEACRAGGVRLLKPLRDRARRLEFRLGPAKFGG